MKLLLRYLRVDGCWITESGVDLPHEAQKAIDSTVGFQPEESMLDIDVLYSVRARRYDRASESTPGSYSPSVSVQEAILQIDGRRFGSLERGPLLNWILSVHQDEMLDNLASV